MDKTLTKQTKSKEKDQTIQNMELEIENRLAQMIRKQSTPKEDFCSVHWSVVSDNSDAEKNTDNPALQDSSFNTLHNI